MSKQTAVEWLFAHLLPFLPFSDPKEREHFRKCLEEAKRMEREQIEDAHGLKYYDLKEEKISGEQYYNETYKGGEQ